MKKLTQISFLIMLLGFIGCSKHTINDVTRWTENGDIQNLIKALDDHQAVIRNQAIEALGQLKAVQAVDPLIAMLDDTEETACLAAKALGLIGDQKASAPLAEKFRTSSLKRRLACGQALGKIGDLTAAKALVLALGDLNAEIRTVASTELNHIGDAATPAIINGLQSDQELIRKWSAQKLGGQRATQAVDALVVVLDDESKEIACLAATALGLIGDEKASAALAIKFKASDGALCLACGKALGQTGGDVAIKSLVLALDNTNDQVYSTARSALSAIGKPAAPTLYIALRHCLSAAKPQPNFLFLMDDFQLKNMTFSLWIKITIITERIS